MNSNFNFPWIDYKFITYAGGYLERFVWKSSTIANCRCNICGDSEKNKSKTRGFFLKNNEGWGYYCHNCGASMSLRKYLELYFPSLFDQYVRECFEERKQANKKPPTLPDIGPKMSEQSKERLNRISSNKSKIEIVKCVDLPNQHLAVAYLRERNIPEKWFSKLMYVSDFARMIDSEKAESNDKRVVIPIKHEGELIGMIGRTLTDRIPRYRNYKIVKDVPMIFNEDNIKNDELLMIVEGAFDSMFLPNSIAIGHSALHKYQNENISNKVLIFDNQPRNVEVMNIMRTAINKNEPVCIWKSSFSKDKDINQMILAGKKQNEIVEFIINNTFSGLKAKLEFGKYCEC